jgi:hypothetical protein
MEGVFTESFEMKLIRMLKPCFVTLETGNIGQMVAVGICSAVLSNYYVVNRRYRLGSFIFTHEDRKAIK